jgi:hypothetical protein
MVLTSRPGLYEGGLLMAAKFLRALAVVILAATALVAVRPTPALAATPVCNTGAVLTQTWPSLTLKWLLPSAGTNFNCLLYEGIYNSSAVGILQAHLNECYNQNIAQDGDFGPATTRALSNAQTWERVARGRNIRTDGIWGGESLFNLHLVAFNFGGACIRIDGTVG